MPLDWQASKPGPAAEFNVILSLDVKQPVGGCHCVCVCVCVYIYIYLCVCGLYLQGHVAPGNSSCHRCRCRHLAMINKWLNYVTCTIIRFMFEMNPFVLEWTKRWCYLSGATSWTKRRLQSSCVLHYSLVRVLRRQMATPTYVTSRTTVSHRHQLVRSKLV